MKYLKMLGLVAFASLALTLLAGGGAASATELTCANGVVCPTGTELHLQSEGGTVFDTATGTIECSSSTLKGSTNNLGGASETVEANVEIVGFSGCNVEAFEVLKKGTLEFHTRTTSANHDGTLTSTNLTITILFLGFHCLWATHTADIGTVTGSSTTGGHATIDLSGSLMADGGRSGIFCGSSIFWTGSYQFSKPEVLNVD